MEIWRLDEWSSLSRSRVLVVKGPLLPVGVSVFHLHLLCDFGHITVLCLSFPLCTIGITTMRTPRYGVYGLDEAVELHVFRMCGKES